MSVLIWMDSASNVYVLSRMLAAECVGLSHWQMDPVAVLDALQARGFASDALESVGQRIIGMEVVGVDDLVAAGLSGGDVVAVRRALDPKVSTMIVDSELRCRLGNFEGSELHAPAGVSESVVQVGMATTHWHHCWA